MLATINETQAVFFTRELVSVDPATGKVRFSHHWRPAMRASVNACTPVILATSCLPPPATAKAPLFGRRRRRIKTVWTNDTSMSCHYSSCVVKNGLYWLPRPTGRADCAVDFKTGRVHWSQPGLRSGTVTLAGDLLVLSERGELVRAAASANGVPGQATRPHHQRRSPRLPGLSPGRFYFRDGETLRCLQLKQPWSLACAMDTTVSSLA